MYNVMIVDDEPVIRFGLKASIEWEKEDLCLIGDYSNGEQAWEAIQQQPVDILITDIKMPLMDGLELTKRTVRRSSSTKVILVSSYADFEYVREGIQLGAVDYVLKPTLEPKEFVVLLQKCIHLLKEERSVKEKLTAWEETNRKQEQKNTEDMMKKVLFEEQDASLLKECSPWLEKKLLVALLELDYMEQRSQQYEFLQKTAVLEQTQSLFYEYEPAGIYFPIGENELLLCVQAESDPAGQLKQLQEQTVKKGFSFSVEWAVMDQVEAIRESEPFVKANAGNENELVTKALRYIHGHYTEELTLQKLADHVHISRNYFSVLFKRFSGQNFIDYVIELRVKKAMDLLEKTALKVYEVAEQSGFNDVKYFSKLFKKSTGYSPVDYRSKKQQGRL